MKGKPWSVDEEKQLRQMVAAHKSVRAIAKALGKTRDCIHMKIARLDLEVVVGSEKNASTTTTTGKLALPLELPSIEEELKVLAAALRALETSGLDKTEVLRLRGIIGGVKVYQELIAEYVDYRGIEAELVKSREEYEQLAKKAQGNAAKPNKS
ncbi:hypothetical protein MUP79_09880 [Candidatus Bathyarchaeota archaeon]|nr:hypothetical protein [Candidatus Bathyarchaeota archaeon]